MPGTVIRTNSHEGLNPRARYFRFLVTASILLTAAGKGQAASVAVAPTLVSLSASQSQQFTATLSGIAHSGVSWTLSPAVGTVSSSGLYKAPSSVASAQNVKLTATSTNNTAASASITINLIPVAVSMTPAAVSLLPSQSQTFTAAVTGSTTLGVTWSLSPTVGSLVSSATSAVYVAPSTAPTTQSVTMTATSMANPSKTATAVITLLQAVTISLSPAGVSLGSSGTQQFSPRRFWEPAIPQ